MHVTKNIINFKSLMIAIEYCLLKKMHSILDL